MKVETNTTIAQAEIVAREHWTISEARSRSLQNLKPFPKGKSGNPGGRPKDQSLTAELRRWALAGDTPERIAQKVVEKALAGSIDHLRLLFDRVDGLLTKPIRVEAVARLEELSDEELTLIIHEGRTAMQAAQNGELCDAHGTQLLAGP